MQAVLRGLRNNDVVLLRGDNKRDLVQEYVRTRFKCTTFSALNMDLKQVSVCLGSRRWDGGIVARPVIIFYRCEQWMRELAPLIRGRPRTQAILIISDGVYTAQTPLMTSLATVTLVAGRLQPTIFSSLKAGRPLVNKEESPYPERYHDAIVCSDLDVVLDQIHHSISPSLDMASTISEALSDIDSILRHRVPDEIMSHCMPILPTITYKTQTKQCKRLYTNVAFAKTLPLLVAKTTGSMMNQHQTLEYIRSAHQITISPQTARFPRDDNDPRLVANVNDKIRVLVCPASLLVPIPHEENNNKTMNDDSMIVFGHPIEMNRVNTLAARYNSEQTKSTLPMSTAAAVVAVQATSAVTIPVSMKRKRVM
jgi:hypothetical protein